MKRHYYTTEEQESYCEGRNDESRNRRNYERDNYSSDPADLAYFQGRKDVEREEAENREQEEWERQQAEDMERRRNEQQRRLREEEEYNMMLQAEIEQQMEDERAYTEAMARGEIHPDYYAPEYDVEPPLEQQSDELNAIPTTEEELFMQIQEDERNESLPNNDTNEQKD